MLIFALLNKAQYDGTLKIFHNNPK